MARYAVCVVVSLLAFSGVLERNAVCASERPNIVFIFADDWGWGDLSCHGHPYVKTPNIDRLAREGTDFHRFTVASGVCSPSRTAVMTGHFPARTTLTDILHGLNRMLVAICPTGLIQMLHCYLACCNRLVPYRALWEMASR